MSSQKRKLHSDDAEASPSKKTTKHASPSNKKTKHASPSKKKTHDAKIFPKAHKRPRSLFETRIIISSGESDSDFQDDADNDPDWIAETQSKCLSSEDENGQNAATDQNGASIKGVRKTGVKRTKEKKRKKRNKTEVDTTICKKRKESDSHKYVCHICQMELSSLGNLNQHLKNHGCDEFGSENAIKQEMCDICMRVLTNIELHKKGHTQDESYQTSTGVHECLNCLKCYDDAFKLASHRRNYCPLVGETKEDCNSAGEEDAACSKDEPQQGKSELFKCDTCSAQFESYSDLQEHFASHIKTTKGRRNNYVRCPKCDFKCCSFSVLQIHNTVVHINKGLGVHKCDVCHRGFGHETLLYNHKREKHSESKLKCHFCRLLFATKRSRHQHEYDTHTGKHVCEYCGKSMRTRPAISAHRKRCLMNPNKQQKSASSSNRTSTNVTSLTSPSQQHERSVKLRHRIPQSERYECRKCCLSFESRENYVMHKQICQSSAETENNLHSGNESQTGKKIYECGACQEIFHSLVQLCAHEGEHKMVVCKDCDEIFPDENTLEMHVLLECPEIYKLFSNKMHIEEIDTNRDAAEGVATSQENEKSSNPVDSSTTCTNVNIENVNEQMNDIARDEKPRISGTAEEKADTEDFICNICSRNLKNAKALKQHKILHIKDQQLQAETGQFECPHCLKRYDFKFNLNLHTRWLCHCDDEMNRRQVFVCKICSREVSTSAMLKQHEILHKEDQHRQSEIGQFECPHCLKRYEEKSHLYRHIQYFCHYHDYVCSICCAQFQNIELLLVHEMVHVVHVIPREQGFEEDSPDESEEMEEEGLEKDASKNGTKSDQMATDIQDDYNGETVISDKICSSCNVEFISTAALKEHQKRVSLTESKYPFKCPICPGASTCRPLMVSACAYLQHKKQLKFLCQFCGMHFENNNHFHYGLAKHINQFHDYENKKECPGCHRIFGSQEYLQHVEYNRKEVEHLNHKCLSCGKVFDSVEALDKHASYRFKYTCDICFRHCYNFKEFEKHRKQYHSITCTKQGSKLLPGYWCKHCDKFFEKASLLSAHVKSILDKESSESLLCSWEYKYSTCLHCGVTFTKRSDFEQHKYMWSYACYMCHEHSKNNSLLKVHRQKHTLLQNTGKETCTTPQFLKCKYCGQNFDTVVDKRKHESKMAFQKAYQTIKFPLPCKDCSEMLNTKCQMDIHKMRHNQRPIVSCRFCHMEFPRIKGPVSLTKHARRIHWNCKTCGVKISNSCQKEMHWRKHVEENKGKKGGERVMYAGAQCIHCGAQFKSIRAKESHERVCTSLKKVWCSVCAAEFPNCQVLATEHRRHIVDKIKGRLCAFCLKDIPKSYRTHQKFQDKAYLCSCGEKIQARCQKKQHGADHKFSCYKCGGHFETYQDLITHLLKYNINNVVNTKNTAAVRSGTKQLLVEKRLWGTIQKNGETINICMHCGDKVKTSDEKSEHESTFKYECLQCMKHFRTPLAATHHFQEVKHVISCKRKQNVSKNADHPTGSQKNQGKRRKDDILTLYWQQSECDRLHHQYKENEQQSPRSTVEFQIGNEVYSVLINNTAAVNEDMSSESLTVSNEAQHECHVSSSSKVPQRNEGAAHDDGTMVSSSKTTGESHLKEACETGVKSSDQKHTKQYVCMHCKRTFCGSHKYKCHVFYLGKDTSGLLYTCTKCENSFDVVCSLKYHIACMCKHCGMHFSNAKAKWKHAQQCRIETDLMNSNKISSDVMVDEGKDVVEVMDEGDDNGGETDTAPEAECIEVVGSDEVNEQRSSVHSKEDNDNTAKDDTETEKENDDDQHKDHEMESEMAVGDDKMMMDSEARNAAQFYQNDQERRSNRVRKKKEKGSLIMPVTRKASNLQQKAVVNEKKCEFCLGIAKQHKNKPPCGNLKCYLNDKSLKWMRCVCLHCNLELPTKCHINYHLAKYTSPESPHQCPKAHCGKHFPRLLSATKHSCQRCKHCVEINCNSQSDLEMHMRNWHEIVYKEIPVAPAVFIGSESVGADKIPGEDEMMEVNKGDQEKKSSAESKQDETSMYTDIPVVPEVFIQSESVGADESPDEDEMIEVVVQVVSDEEEGDREKSSTLIEKQLPKQIQQARQQNATEALKNLAHIAAKDKHELSSALVKTQLPMQSQQRGWAPTQAPTEVTAAAMVPTLECTSAGLRLVNHTQQRPILTGTPKGSTVTMGRLKPTQAATEKTTTVQGPNTVVPTSGLYLKGTLNRSTVTMGELEMTTVQGDTTMVPSSENTLAGSRITSTQPMLTGTPLASTVTLDRLDHRSYLKPAQFPTATELKATTVSAINKEKQEGSKSVPLAKARNPSTGKANVDILPGGLTDLNNIELSAEKASITKRVFGEKVALNHFVEYVTINNQSYLTFNYPSSHTGILNAGLQNDEKFSVMIMLKDQKNKPSGKMGSEALVVKIGPHKIDFIRRLNNLSDNYTYIVELTKTLPASSKEVNSTPVNGPTGPVTPRQGNLTISVATKQLNSRPPFITKVVNSTLPITSTMRGINSAPVVTSKVNSVTPITIKEMNSVSKPLLIRNVVNSALPIISTMRGINSTPAITTEVNSVTPITIKEMNSVSKPLLITNVVNSTLPIISTMRGINSTPAITTEVNSVTPITIKEMNSVSKPLLITNVVNSTLPIISTMRGINSTPAITTEVNSVTPITIKEMNSVSKPLLIRNVVNSTLPIISTMRGINSTPAVTSEVNSVTAVAINKGKQEASTSVRLRNNPSTGKANVAILPGGLVDLANIVLTAEKASIRRTSLIGEKVDNHFVEGLTINNHGYLAFNHPASHMGLFNIFGQDEEKFSVMIMHSDENNVLSGGMRQRRQALVVDIGQHKVNTIDRLNNLPGNYTYIVELTKT
ncbi:uncharacterized protein [Amphiura filiformis]|uniref:uncharacterized protein n=1 Tax=Amphiura filiformis TaxID=82378 RepID=UPI003B22060E